MASAARPGMAQGAGGATSFSGVRLLIAGLILASANFIVVLDLTIANVSVPHIAGGLAVSVSSGTWVITSYAVAEAICVPLTGWLANRFGTLRTFIVSLLGFGLFSVLCGLSSSLEMLVLFRLGQGFCGGPLMPLTQTLMLRIFPREMHPRAMALWAMTVVVGPILGPIFGGWISDNWSWEWIFFINLPIIGVIFFGVFSMLRGIETPTQKLPIDVVGLGLLVVWVGSLQLMLDKGREEDWFSSPFIVTCAVVSAIFFCVFLIWELTEEHPIVDLKVFRHRGFTAATISLTLAFGTYFASVVVIPQWLQTSLGYTATQAGYAMAFSGVLAVIASPLVPRLMQRVDPRLLVSLGIGWIGMVACLRAIWWSTDATFWTIAMPQLIQGMGVALFMVPLTTISLSSVDPRETASAAGIANFGRTLAGAIATATITTLWSDMARSDGADMVGSLNGADRTVSLLEANGFTPGQAKAALAQIVEQQGMAQSTTHVFAIASVVLFLAALTIWLAPRPRRGTPAAAGGH
ncbi:DHA2 family efflux MFS transporter permease subunit [Novosphingobium album (ex Liu et al. 2023)]|uniref:DHA2 family efflux MFS transporter permease subunit n=1 Tax=Novosphingobium album (ex Liu et al. 2023) TaxID=3031130 RepID=A0ABT5WX11_9SPHN|nr:DHA2 family efflux MFS transporter permease subunit [Novosphingobium album (ex Liu et al. 2023)]MDE8654433.1 DHA2 family efflux MFS transporter permease subunit [Novosphingobium album (ex Liu et al. 2023)]